MSKHIKLMESPLGQTSFWSQKGDDAAAQRQMPHSRGSRDTLTGMATARRRLVADSPRRANPHVTATISLPRFPQLRMAPLLGTGP